MGIVDLIWGLDLIKELWTLYGPSGSNMEIVDLIWA